MITIKKVLAIVALSILQQYAYATTYYIDSQLGNDLWSGKLSNTTASPSLDGPWQSLAQLAKADLLPGDAVLLRCGQIWHETLRIRTSGSISQPIRIGAYPTPCNAKPLIDGTVAIPAHAWSSGEDGAYRSNFPVSLLTNGRFDQGTARWHNWSSDGSVGITTDSVNCASGAAPCLSIHGGANSTTWLANSYSFTLEAGKTYQLTLAIRVPTGKTVRANIRRAAPPWDTVGATTITGNNAWQSVNLSFRAAASVQDARLDIQGTGNVSAYIDNVSLTPVVDTPIGLYVDGTAHVIAYHPNRGHDANAPESPYLLLSSDADVVNGIGSTYLPLAKDPSAPNTAELLVPGVSVSVRSSRWKIERKTISAVQPDRVLLDSPTVYPLRTGFGYFFTGARWMLDEPGEWLYDTLDRAIHLRTFDMAAPSNRVSIVHLQSGVDLSGRADIELRGLAIRRTGVGINLSRSTRVAVIDCQIEDTVNEGLLAADSKSGLIQNNRIVNTGLDAISGVRKESIGAVSLHVLDNQIEGSGVISQNGRILSLPAPSVGAVSTGTGATINGNRIRNTAYHGISPLANSTIHRNEIENACAVLDDCGGIYVDGQKNNAKIEDNIIRNLVGNIHGRPGEWPHAVGIYLDELSSGVTVARNTVENAEYGIQLHNAAHNHVDANILYGNRRYQLWLQEATRVVDPAGDISGNIITHNLIFPTGNALGVVQDSAFSSTTRFASYDFNYYSALLSKQIARERWKGGEVGFNFIEWQSAQSSGILRQLDSNGKQITQVGYTSFQVQGESLIAPINTAADMTGWRAWNDASPRAKVTVGICGAQPCVTLVSGITSSLLSTPSFSVEAGRWYRLTFDMKTKLDNQKIGLSPRRGGGGDNGYELFTHAMTTIYGTTTWKRHTLLIEATLTIQKNDPITGDVGARIDFQNIKPGEEITLANVEMVPLLPVGTALRTALLSNPTSLEIDTPCPDEDVSPTSCGQYVSFPTGKAIFWPHQLAPHSSEIVYTQDATLIDSDGDGIADVQDQCPETPQSLATNSLGCPFLLGS